MRNSQHRKLITTGQTVCILDTFESHGNKYCHVLIPFSHSERIFSCGNKCWHLQIVRENKLATI